MARQAFRHVLLYLLIAIPLAVVTAAGFLLLPFAATISPIYGPILLAVLVGFLLLWLVITTWARLPRLVNRLVPMTSYNPNHIVREFSLDISSASNIGALADVAVWWISKAIDIQRGMMFNVEYDA